MNDSEPREGARPSRRDAPSRPSPRGNLGGARERGSLAGKTVATAMREPARAGKVRDGVDVICAGMYRACSTWQYEVVAHLLEHHRAGRRLGYLTPEEYVRTGRADARKDGPNLPPNPGWNVFKSHDADRCFARSIGQGRAVVVYAYRDVRDVVFSLMHKRSLTFEQLLRQGMIHQVLANDRFWARQPGALIQRYDAILADPVGAVAELARYLGIDPEVGEVERIAHEYSLASNKARTDALRRRLEQEGVDLKESANSLICDPATLLHWNHVRDGGSGSWFAEATPRQRVILEKLCGRWLKSHDYPSLPEGTAPDAYEPLRLASGEKLRLELDIVAGWLSYRVRATSQRFPRLAATIKRWLGIADSSQAGAIVWSERKTGDSG
jgi:Sulfotransferase domain